MSDRLNFDTLDILAAVAGVAFAFFLLPFPAERNTERIVVGLSALAAVTLKRFFIKTKKSNPDSKPGVRLAYLFLALVGTVCLALPLLAIFDDSMAEYREGLVFNTLLGLGITLLVIATCIDQRFLKI